MTSEHKNIPIVFSTDHNFIMPTGVSIYSLLASRESTNYDIYVIVSNNVTEDDKNLLKKQVQVLSTDSTINFISIGDNFKNSYEIRGVTVATYYRLLIPWLLPNLDKVIYSDGDIIFKGSLRDLYNRELNGNYICGNQKKKWQPQAAKRIKKLGLEPKDYSNAGFLIINSKAQRDANLYDAYMRHAQKQYYFQDQDIINIVCSGKKAFFGPIYNCTPSVFNDLCRDADINYSDIKVIHYAGTKPWSRFCPFWMEWWEAYRNSIFFNPNLYYSVTAKSLNPKEFVKNLWVKAINKYLK